MSNLSDIRGLSEDNELTQTILAKFKEIVGNHIPSDFGYVQIAFNKAIFTNYIIVTFAPSNIAINNVKNQFTQKVALWLNLHDLTLEPVNLGGMGAQTLHLIPTTGKNLVYESVKIPFRKPKAALPEIYAALDRFCARYVQALKDNVERLPHKDLLSPAANKMLGLPEYTFVTDKVNPDTTIIKSTNSQLLNFVGIAMISDFGSVKYALSIPTSFVATAQNYIDLWYETSKEASQKQAEILLRDVE